MRSSAPPATAASTSFVHSSSGATCAPPPSSRSMYSESWISPSSHGQMSVVQSRREPGVTESTGILRYDAMPSSLASSSCSANDLRCSATVGPEPQSRARKPPPLPAAAAATLCRSTIMGFTPRFVR